MTLYELTGEYRRLYDLADELDNDDFAEALQDALDGLDGDFEKKAESYGIVIKNLESDLETIKNETARLSERKAALTKNIDAMKKRLQAAMIEAGKPKFKTALLSFNIQRNPQRVVLDESDISKIPLEYLTVQMPTINKTAIRDAMKEGKDLTGIAHFEQDETLRIR